MRFALVLNLIGWESGASFLYQSQTKAKTKAVLDYCRQPTENCSITQFFPNHCWVHWGLLNWTTTKNQKLTWNPVIISSFLFILCSLKRRYEKTHCFQNALGEENTKKSCTLTRLNILMNKKTLIPDTRYINNGLKSYCSHQLTYAHFEKIQFYFNYKLWRITTSILSMKKATNLENFSKNLLGQLVCWESGLDHMLWKSI